MSKLPGKDSIFWESPALLNGFSKHYPEHFKGLIPLRVKILRFVYPDYNLDGTAGHCSENEICVVWTNIHGAVTAECAGNRKLGLRPDEFEVIEWYDRETKEIVRFETKEIRTKGDGSDKLEQSPAAKAMEDWSANSKANAVIIGNIDVADEYDRPYHDKVGYEGPINLYERSMLIQFPDVPSLREAMDSKKVEFTLLGS